MLALVVIAAPLLAPRDAVEVTSRTGIAAALFSANAYLYRATAVGYFGTVAELNPLLHTWSLSVEEQFYFVMPVLLWLAWRLGRRAGRPLLALRLFIIGLFSVSFVACLVFSFAGSVGPIDGLRFAFFSPVTRAWEFAVGLGLVVLPLRWSVSPRLRAAFIVIGLGLIGVATLLYTDSTVFPGVAALLPVLGAALVIYGGTSSTGEERGSRTRAALRPMVRLGDLSYSWYLWHWPMIVFAGAFWPNAGRLPLVAAAAFSLFPAWISYHTLEQRLRATSRTRTWPTVALAGCCIAAPLVAAVVARPITASISRQPAIGRFADGGEPHQDEVAGCEDETPLGDRAPDACIRGNLTSDTSVLLIGDSNAGHFSETLIGAAESTSARLQIATLNSCPFIDAIVELDANLGSGPEASGVCREFVLRAVEDLESQQPDVVVIANATDRYVVLDEVALVDPATGIRATSKSAKGRVYEAGLERVVSRLTGLGIRVVVINVVPKPWAVGLDFDSRECSNLLLLVEASRCSFGSFRVADGVTLDSNGIEERAAAAGGAESWDFNDEICPSGHCTGRIGEAIVWFEPLHITVATSEALASTAAELLGRVESDRERSGQPESAESGG